MERGAVGLRIKRARKQLGREATQQWLAKNLGISQPRLSNWERGLNDPPPKMLAQIAELLQVEEIWLRRGTAEDRLAESRRLDLDRPRFPVSYATVEMRFSGVVPTSESWGDPLSSEEPIEMEAKFDGPRRFVARVVGDSCYPCLQQGDLTVWQQDFAPPYGKVVLAQRKGDHGCTVKQLAWDGSEGRPILKPVNPLRNAPPDGEGWGAIARLVGVVFRMNGAELSVHKPEGITPGDLDWRSGIQ